MASQVATIFWGTGRGGGCPWDPQIPRAFLSAWRTSSLSHSLILPPACHQRRERMSSWILGFRETLRLERNLWSAIGWMQHILACRAESWALIWVPWCDFDNFSSLGLWFIFSTIHSLLDLCGGQELRAHLLRLSPSNWIPQKAFGKSWTGLTSLKKAPGQHLPKEMWYEPHLLL